MSSLLLFFFLLSILFYLSPLCLCSSAPCFVFSFSPVFLVLSSLFVLVLFFYPSPAFSCPLPSALSSPVFIGEKWGKRGLLPLSSHGIGVGWLGLPLGSRLRAA